MKCHTLKTLQNISYIMYLSKPQLSVWNMMIKAQKQNIQKECKQKMSMTRAKNKKEEKRRAYALMIHIQNQLFHYLDSPTVLQVAEVHPNLA